MTDAYKAGREADLKRHEWKLPAANWLRDEINQVLSRYDIHPDVYEKDIRIDALCVVAVDKITALLDAPAPVETSAGMTVQEAAKVLLDQPYHVMAKAFDAMEAKQGEGADRVMAAALRALSETKP